MNTHRMQWDALAAMLFIGAVSAVAGGIGLLGGGLTFPLDWLDGSPFTDYTIPGIILAIVGGVQFIAAVAMLRRLEGSVTAGAFAGIVMMGWIAGEVLIVGTHGGLMLTLQLIYFAVGLVQLALAALLTRERQRL